MIRNLLFTILLALTISFSFAQEKNRGKQLWAKSMLNKKAPELIVEKWLTDTPKVEGKFVLVDFWATWCGPCRAAIPELNEWSRKYADKMVIIGISAEPEEKVRSFSNPALEYFSAIDTQKRLNKELEISGIPHCLLISPEGKVIWEGFPFLNGHELNEKVLERLFNKYQVKSDEVK